MEKQQVLDLLGAFFTGLETSSGQTFSVRFLFSDARNEWYEWNGERFVLTGVWPSRPTSEAETKVTHKEWGSESKKSD